MASLILGAEPIESLLMSRIIYINGCYYPYHQACLHVEDRATLFADAVYEVIEVKDGLRVDEQGHLKRLERSLKELKITPRFSIDGLAFVIREVVRRNRVQNGFVYMQISRGIAKRDFVFPDRQTTPCSVTIFARSKSQDLFDASAQKGIKVITCPDIRWSRPDIKTTALVASVLARQQAKECGAQEAWLYNEDHEITEGAASNAWIITDEGDLITHPANGQILKGITREGVMRAAKEQNLTYVERPFDVKEAKMAKEAFISAATNLVMPVTSIDKTTISGGKPGRVTLQLRSIFHEFALMTT